MSQEPTLRNLTNPNFGVPPKEQNNVSVELNNLITFLLLSI